MKAEVTESDMGVLSLFILAIKEGKKCYIGRLNMVKNLYN